MRVGQHHSELVAHGHSGEHIADSAPDSTKHSVSLLLLQPHSELECVLASLLGSFFADVDGDVLEGAGESAQFALHSHLSGLDLDIHVLGHDQLLLCDNVLHDK